VIEDSLFGIWREENSTARYCGSCFDVVINTNEIGASDKPFQQAKNNNKRILFIGDSFWDGFGVPQTKRFTDELERRTGTDVFNLTIGGAGLVQHQLIYSKYHQSYDHDIVFIGLSLPNDFEDNQLSKWKKRKRYRPFLVKQNNNYDIEYHTVPLEKSSFKKKKSKYHVLKNYLTEYSNIYHLSLFLQEVFTHRTILEEAEYEEYELKEEDLELLLVSLKEIKKMAEGKKLVVLISANSEGLKYFQQHKQEAVYINRLREEVNKLDIPLLTFEKYFSPNEYPKLLMTCNDHLTEYGHQRLTDIFMEKYKAQILD